MKVILFGATGMIGQGTLRECLLDDRVTAVLTVGRAKSGQTHPKLREIEHKDLLDLSPIEADLAGYDACLFCLGISSAGMSEADYRRVTYDIALAVAQSLLRASPAIKLVFISGAGTDTKGRAMWARVKGETEDALLALPFKEAYMFRPAMIQPRHGITSRTTSYRILYGVLGPLFPLARAIAPRYVSTTEIVGKAMIEAALHGAPKKVLENDEINALVTSP